MEGGSESGLEGLIDRCKGLEASHLKLKQQFQLVLRERRTTSTCNHQYINEEDFASDDDDDVSSLPGWGQLPVGSFFLGNPYRNVLECMGHAIHVSRTPSWEIIYWNRAAEKLYGYKDYEALGQRTIELLFDEEQLHSALAIMQSLSTGRCWSGQLRLRKRSGQSFMALVTKSPLYEDGELNGIVTVSSDAAVFNNTNSGVIRANRENACEQSKFGKINFRRMQWHPRPQIAEVPQLASSVSNLASKVLSRKRGNVTGDTLRTRECEEVEVESHDVKADKPPKVPITKPAFSMSIGGSRMEAMSMEKEESVSGFTQSSKTGVKFFQKLRIGAISNVEKVVDVNMHQNSSEDNSSRKEASNLTNLTITQENSSKGIPVCTCQGCCEVHRPAGHLPRSSLQLDGSKLVVNVPSTKSPSSEDASPRQSGYHKITSPGECFGDGHGSLSRKGDNDLPMSSEIRWDDLHLREEIGQGSFAVVYRGLWNGSDVAVKVYSGNQYSEETLLDSKKEIDIIRRLRHPNVLLFMGAVISEGRVAMVTEYMTRGSLFKTLHKNNQSLDMRRRLRMAIDVARGMNYLHRRNPPVVHRDLKSSNLLVDKSWNVKVGDFGLSKLKYATFLTAKSGRGTPQWMAPEVLRNELSTEKSDVFSFGVILWELVTESIPWSDLNPLQVVGIVGFMDRRLDLPDNIDPRLSSIISECWQSNPEDRPSFEHIIHKLTHLVHAGAGMTPRTAPTS